jgi:hypothetical protein
MKVGHSLCSPSTTVKLETSRLTLGLVVLTLFRKDRKCRWKKDRKIRALQDRSRWKNKSHPTCETSSPYSSFSGDFITKGP